MLAERSKIPSARLDDATLIVDLGIDSFALIELLIDLQEELKIRLSSGDLDSVRTIGELLHVLEDRTRAVAAQ